MKKFTLALVGVLWLAGMSLAAVPEWHLLNAVATQMDVTVDGQHYHTEVADAEVALVNELMVKVSEFLHTHTAGKVKFSFTNYTTNEPITSLSEVDYSHFDVIPHPVDKNYYPMVKNLPEVIWRQMTDHDVMIATVRMPEKLASNWRGLGSTQYAVIRLFDFSQYQEIGFEQFHLQFYLHELMHSFLNYFATIGYQIPNIHRPADYGYASEMELFAAILSGEMRDPATGRNLGITAAMWAKSPLSQVFVPPTIKLDLSDLHLVEGKLVLQVGQEVHAQLKATISPDNHEAVVTYFDNHELPHGLTLSEQGLLSGRPTIVGRRYVSVTAQAGIAIDSASFIIEVLPATPNPTPTPAPSLKLDVAALGVVNGQLTLQPGQRVQAQVRTNAPAGTAVTFTSSGLPVGLTLSSTGWLTGSSSAVGQWPVTIIARAAGQQDTASFQLVIAASNSPALPDPQLPGTGGDEGGGGCTVAYLSWLALPLWWLRRQKSV